MQKFIKSGLLLASLLALTACGHMPISTMIALRNFDFAEFDPKQLHIAARVPDWLDHQTGTTTLSVKLWSDGQEKDAVTQEFILEELNKSEDLSALARFRAPDTRIIAYHLSNADVARAQALQEKGRKSRRDNANKNHLTIKFEFKFCHERPIPAGPILTTTYLKPDAATPYLVFLGDVDVRKEVGNADLASLIPPCAKSTQRAT